MKHIFKYMGRTRDYMLTYGGSDLISVDYTDSNFMSDIDSRKSTSIYVLGDQLEEYKATVCC